VDGKRGSLTAGAIATGLRLRRCHQSVIDLSPDIQMNSLVQRGGTRPLGLG
jgi:hypothetical protein